MRARRLCGRLALALALLEFGSACTSAAPHDGADLVRRLDAAASQAIARGPQPGASVAVARDGVTLLAKGYGVADVSKGVAARPDTVYGIGSITKQFTAAAILDLAERGRLRVDDDVAKFLPDYPTQGRDLTLRHLLTHTSGIANYTDDPRYGPLSLSSATRPDVMALFAGKSDFAPGTSWAYSNSNYFLLGLVIEQVSGRPYDAYLEDEIFGPLGMADTGLCPDRPSGDQQARGYDVISGKSVDAMAVNMAHAFAAGALCSTVEDLVRWNNALHGGRFLTPASYELMTAPVALDGGRAFPYGFGLMLDDRGGSLSFDHGGSVAGFSSSLTFRTADRTTIAVLTNTGGPAGAEVVDKIMAAASGPCEVESPVAPRRHKAALPQAVANGGFEAGDLRAWTVDNQPAGRGGWFVYAGGVAPLICSPIPRPPEGTNAAVTEPCGRSALAGAAAVTADAGWGDRTRPCGKLPDGPGAHALSQDVALAAGMDHELRFTLAYSNQAGAFSAPDTLDDQAFPNQQYRVDVLRPSAQAFSVAPGDVLAEVFRTRPGDPHDGPDGDVVRPQCVRRHDRADPLRRGRQPLDVPGGGRQRPCREQAPVKDRETLPALGGREGMELATAVGQTWPVEGVAEKAELVAELFRREYDAMVRLAHLVTGSSDAAEELVQDSFVRVYRNWATAERPGAYLRTVVLNRCRSWRRRRVLEREGLARPVAEAVDAESRELLDALAHLGVRQRTALVLKFYLDLPEADIARALKCRPGTVKSLAHRGLRELERMIER